MSYVVDHFVYHSSTVFLGTLDDTQAFDRVEYLNCQSNSVFYFVLIKICFLIDEYVKLCTLSRFIN